MGNPNEYDDAAFTAASNHLQHRLPILLDGLWDAGAEPKDIVNELTNTLNNWDPVLDAGVAGTVIVSLGAPDPETTDQRTLARWHARRAAVLTRPTHQRLGLESQQDFRQRMANAQVHALVALALTVSAS